jgi:cysteine desulfurase/selenocysteine lyase
MSTSDPSQIATAQLTHEIERLARELFAGTGPAPYATNVGAGGVSPAAAPGFDVPGADVPSPAAVTVPDAPKGGASGVPSFDPPSAASLGAPAFATPGAPAFAAPSAPAFAAPNAPAFGALGESPALEVPLATGISPERDADAEPYFLGLAGPPANMPPAAARSDAAPYEFRPDVTSSDVAKSPGVFDPYAVKRDFPILEERVHGKQLVWLDNAATTQKPNAVIERVASFYRHENSNVHRAAHTLAARSTDAYESARQETQRFLNASTAEEIIFVRGATEGINLVAQSWGRRNIGAGDEIVITWLEHHANIVPWQMLCREKGAKLRVVPVDSTGQVILEEYERLLSSRTRLVALPQVSNALGTIVPAREMVEMAHRRGARVLVDGAQSVSHLATDVQLLDCDFFVFSGHKIFAPTGIGVVYGKKDVLADMPPWQAGGNMIADVTFEKTIYQAPPNRFEAGTGNIADAVGLGAALQYVSALGLPNIARHEHELRVYGEQCLAAIPGLRIIGTAPDKAGVISFVLDGHRTEDVGGLLDLEGIAVRSGHHCAQPILRRFGLESTVRASLAPYNTREDIDALVAAVRRLQLGRPGAI